MALFPLLAFSCLAQTLDEDQALNRIIGAVYLKGDAQGTENLPLKPGERLTSEKLDAAWWAVIAHGRRDGSPAANLQPSRLFRKLTVSPDDASKVDVTMTVYTARINFSKVGGVLSPSLDLEEFVPIPGWLSTYNPRVSLNRDETYGFSQSTAFSSYWNRDKKAWVKDYSPGSLYAGVSGRNSFEHDFYDANVDLSWLNPGAPDTESPDTFSLDASFLATRKPIGEQTSEEIGGRFGSSGEFDLRSAKNSYTEMFAPSQLDYFISVEGKDVNTSGGQPHSSTDLSGTAAGRFAFLLARNPSELSAWVRPAVNTDHSNPYNSLVGQYHYASILPIFSDQTQYIRFDARLRGGGNIGPAPAYSRFYAGNNALDDGLMTDQLPSPVVRSLGEQSASLSGPAGTTSGASSFANISCELAFPIPGLSQPLIPRETDSYGDNLPDLVYNLAELGLNMGRAATPQNLNGMHFIAYNANLYSVKPLLVMDAAYLGAPQGFSSRSLAAAGGGVELTIVLVNIDLIYAQTVYDSENQHQSGNLSFQISYEQRF